MFDKFFEIAEIALEAFIWLAVIGAGICGTLGIIAYCINIF